MLIEFQQAFADLVASPELCIRVRENPEFLRERYELTERELNRLSGIVNHPGMECNCMLYRANRLIPLALNLPDLCKALGEHLRPLASAYWSEFPKTDVHFLVESNRFVDFVKREISDGKSFGEEVPPVLEREGDLLSQRLEASYTERQKASKDGAQAACLQ
jgi:hypothetical protein